MYSGILPMWSRAANVVPLASSYSCGATHALRFSRRFTHAAPSPSRVTTETTDTSVSLTRLQSLPGRCPQPTRMPFPQDEPTPRRTSQGQGGTRMDPLRDARTYHNGKHAVHLVEHLHAGAILGIHGAHRLHPIVADSVSWSHPCYRLAQRNGNHPPTG